MSLKFIANVGGVFLVLGFGCLFALIIAVIEFLWNVKKVAVEERVGFKAFLHDRSTLSNGFRIIPFYTTKIIKTIHALSLSLSDYR